MQIALIIILCFVIIGFFVFKQKSAKVYPKCTDCHFCEVSESGWANCNAPQNFSKSFDGNMVVGKTAKLEHRLSSCNQARLGFGEAPDSLNVPLMRCRPKGKWFVQRGAEDPPLLPTKRIRQADVCEANWNPEVTGDESDGA